MSVKIRAIVITVSDSRNETDDLSGAALMQRLDGIGAHIIEKRIVSDDLEQLIDVLKKSAEKANLVITTGGTGFTQRDNTPEATKDVIEREAPGLAEAIRFRSFENTPKAMLSRGVCGIRGKCLIINLPGSPKAVDECFEVLEPVLQHAINLIEGETRH